MLINTYIYEWNVQFDIDGLSVYKATTIHMSQLMRF